MNLLLTGPFNIICHHMRYEAYNIRQVMPKDSVYITIIRSPISLYPSTFQYYWKYVPAFQFVPSPNDVDLWFRNPEHYWRLSQQYGSNTIHSHFAKNHMMFDLGFDNTREGTNYLTKMVDKLDQEFDFVLLAEHFEESLIILADILKWPLENVACFHLNARERNASYDYPITLQNKIKEWNKGDTFLYHHFNESLFKKIEGFGQEKMQSKLKALKKINNRMLSNCVEKDLVEVKGIHNKHIKSSIFQPNAQVKILSYNLKASARNQTTCRQMVAPEKGFSREVFYMQSKYNRT